MAAKTGSQPGNATTLTNILGPAQNLEDALKNMIASTKSINLHYYNPDNSTDMSRVIRPITVTSWNLNSLQNIMSLENRISSIRNHTNKGILCLQETHDPNAAYRLRTRMVITITRNIPPIPITNGRNRGGLTWVIRSHLGYKDITEPTIITPGYAGEVRCKY